MVFIGDKEYTPEEYLEMRRREQAEMFARYEAEEQARKAEREEAARLIRQLGAAYTEYVNFLEAHPHLRPEAGGDPASDQDQLFYEKLRQNLGHADEAPRCTHIKADGIRCGSPRMKTGAFCYTHEQMLKARGEFRMPAIDDANGIQLALMQVAQAMLDGRITDKHAGKLLYTLQNAAFNVPRVTFHQSPKEMVVEVPEPAAPVAPPPCALLPCAPSSCASLSCASPSSAPPPAAFRYDLIDEDLKLKLFAIGDELDRRARESAAGGQSPEAGSRTG
jgi:hypothetical protein